MNFADPLTRADRRKIIADIADLLHMTKDIFSSAFVRDLSPARGRGIFLPFVSVLPGRMCAKI